MLHIPSSVTLDDEQGLTGMGMDSLMAVELCNKLRIAFQQPLPKTIAFEYPSIDALTDYIFNDVLAPLVPSEIERTMEASRKASDVQEKKDFTDLGKDELESALKKELDDIGY